MPSTTASTSALALTALLLSSSTTSAQLLGCDAVGCPVDEYRRAHCEVGNATLKAVGIANVTTSLSPAPLTWTLGLQELDNNGTQPLFDRNFYLGTPASLKLDDSTGCALFFEGVSSNLTAPNADQLDKFTCSNSLAESCISDLVAQAQSNYKSLNNGTSKGPALCNQLRDSLANLPPSTCNGVTGSWGTITAQRKLHFSFISPYPHPKCHATTGKDYTLSLISSSRSTAASRDYSQLAPILHAVTPVMTVLGKDSEAEVKLTCLKLVESKAGRTVDVPDAQGGAPKVLAGGAIWSGMVAITWLWLVLL
ncbi:hypothetical protein SVAN01_00855 [Stagonosporopsis vannaccii]|nr:hypothetical protein SVAN01_00855 [Stagonosporopsis vannaccii]